MTIFIYAARHKAKDISAAVIVGPHGDKTCGEYDETWNEQISYRGCTLEPVRWSRGIQQDHPLAVLVVSS